jgi:hypothetical protein
LILISEHSALIAEYKTGTDAPSVMTMEFPTQSTETNQTVLFNLVSNITTQSSKISTFEPDLDRMKLAINTTFEALITDELRNTFGGPARI